MEEFKIRLYDEQSALADKFNKLEEFINSDEFHKLNFKLRWYTKLQYYHMTHYFNCLTKRISIICTIDDLEDYVAIVAEREKTLLKGKEAPKKKKKNNKKEKKND